MHIMFYENLITYATIIILLSLSYMNLYVYLYTAWK